MNNTCVEIPAARVLEGLAAMLIDKQRKPAQRVKPFKVGDPVLALVATIDGAVWTPGRVCHVHREAFDTHRYDVACNGSPLPRLLLRVRDISVKRATRLV